METPQIYNAKTIKYSEAKKCIFKKEVGIIDEECKAFFKDNHFVE